MMRRGFLYVLISFLILGLANVVCYIIIKQYTNISSQAFWELFISPLGFSLLLFVCLLFIKWIRNKWVIVFPLFFLILKGLLLLRVGYSLSLADSMLTLSQNFSNLFSIILFQLQKNNYSSEVVEILVLTVGMFIYQVVILYLAKRIGDRVVLQS